MNTAYLLSTLFVVCFFHVAHSCSFANIPDVLSGTQYSATITGSSTDLSYFDGGGSLYCATRINPAVKFACYGSGTTFLVAGQGASCQSNTFTVYAPLSLTVHTTNLLCNSVGYQAAVGSASVTVSGGSGSYTYSWSSSSSTTNSASGFAPGTGYTITVTDAIANVVPAVTNTFSITQPDVLTATASATNPRCPNSPGLVSAVVSGGTLPYTYLWTTPYDNTTAGVSVPPGTYSVTVGDANNCPVTQPGSVTVTAPSTPVLVAFLSASTNNACPWDTNGAATFAISGGIPPYMVQWYDGVLTQTFSSTGTAQVSNLASGTYTATISDANGCTVAPIQVIITPPAFVASISFTPPLCHGSSTGTATAVVTGGTLPYTYIWSSSANTATASNLPAGQISVQVTDAHSCIVPLSSQLSTTVTEPADLVITPTQTNVGCNGQSTGVAGVASVTGGSSSYTYLWSTGSTASSISNLPAASYFVTVTDTNRCSKIQSYTIIQPDAFTVLTGTPVNPICFGGTGSLVVAPIGGVSPFVYSWSPVHSSAQSLSSLPAGIYTVTATDYCGVQNEKTVTLVQPDLIELYPHQVDVACYGTQTGSATVIVQGGVPPYTYSWSPIGGSEPTARNLAAGTYVVTVTDSGGCSQTETFIIIEPAALVVTPTITNPSCSGRYDGSVSLAVSGGSDRYIFQWAPTSAGAGSSISNIAAGYYTAIITDAQYCSQRQTFTVSEPQQLTITGTQVDVACYGGSTGSATVVVSGGTPGYTYSWWPSGVTSDTATGLSAGTNFVTVLDANGCYDTYYFYIYEPGPLAIYPSQVNVACNGQLSGSATALVYGGVAGYTYAWSPSISATTSTVSSLGMGTYVLTVTDSNSCIATNTYTITEPAALSIAGSSQVDVVCYGASTGSATVSVSGGTQAYTYSWTPSGQTGSTATNLAAGVHSVTITDASGCTISHPFTIVEPTNQLTTTGTQVDVVCHGGSTGSATVIASGGTSGYTYLWSPSGGSSDTATALSAGTYVVTVTDINGCYVTRSFTITEPAPLTIAPTQVNVACNGQHSGSATALVSGGTAGYTYAWSPSISATTSTVSSLAMGTYVLTVTDSNTCTATNVYTITEPAALSISSSSQVDVVCYGASTGSATVSVSGGTQVYTYSWTPSGQTGSTATNLPSGVHSVTITDAKGCTITHPFTIIELATPISLLGSSTIDVLCHGGSSGSASALATGGTPGYTYSWSPSSQTGPAASSLSAGVYQLTITDANACTHVESFSISEPSALALVSSQANVSCNGGQSGSATVSVSGGVGNYTYSWSSNDTTSNASSLGAGEYNVTVTDANECYIEAFFWISEPDKLVVTTSQVDNVCNGAYGGSATVSAIGGSQPYSYLWSNGNTTSDISGLVAGEYQVSVSDASGCSTNTSITVSQPAPYCVHGTCIGLQACACSQGWIGTDCSQPFCESACLHNGNCSEPSTCSCTSQWAGPICNISTNTTRVTYVVTLIQIYKKDSTVSIPAYRALLAAALNISEDSINVTAQNITDNSKKRAALSTMLTSIIRLSKTGSSQNRTEEIVLSAATSTPINEYLASSGSDSSNNQAYIGDVQLQTEPIVVAEQSPPPSTHSNSKSKTNVRVALGVGLGIGLPVTTALVVGAVFAHKYKKRTPGLNNRE